MRHENVVKFKTSLRWSCEAETECSEARIVHREAEGRNRKEIERARAGLLRRGIGTSQRYET